MKLTDRLGLLLLALAVVFFLSIVAPSIDHLPLRMATHFNADGVADGWMDRTRFRVTMIGTMVAVPLSIILVTMLVRYLPDRFLNIPNRQFWLSADRRNETHAAILDFGMAAAGSTLWLFSMLYRGVIRANEVPGARFAPGWEIMTLPMLILAVALIRLVAKFRRAPVEK